MKKKLLTYFLVCFAAFGAKNLSAQCRIDSSYNSPGVYPDTLKNACIGEYFFDTLQFVFPSDTTILGNTIFFDSFEVGSLTIPPSLDWLQWECNNNAGNCTYVTTPGQLTRGCVSLEGCPNKPTPANGDSLEVVGIAWITLFGAAQSIPQTIYLRAFVPDSATCYFSPPCVVSIPGLDLGNNLNMRVFPNPVQQSTELEFVLESPARVKVEVLDIYGRILDLPFEGKMSSGKQHLRLDRLHLPGAGIYFIRLNLNEGEFTKSLKVNVMNW